MELIISGILALACVVAIPFAIRHYIREQKAMEAIIAHRESVRNAFKAHYQSQLDAVRKARAASLIGE
jgi:hypothetical protein